MGVKWKQFQKDIAVPMIFCFTKDKKQRNVTNPLFYLRFVKSIKRSKSFETIIIFFADIYQRTLMNKQLFKKAPRERKCKQTEKQVWSLWRHAEYDFYSKF